MTVQRDESENALKLGDDDVLKLGDYELGYNSSDEEWQTTYKVPVGGETGYHGQLNGSKFVKDRQSGENAIEFNSGRAIIPNYLPDGLSELTITWWFKCMSNESAENKYFISKDGSGMNDGDFSVRVRDGTFGIVHQDSSDALLELNATTDVTDGDWYFGAVTIDSNKNVNIYTDNVNENNGTTSDDIWYHSRYLALGGPGGDEPGDKFFIDHRLDDVRVYNRALSDAELSDVKSGADLTDGLVSRWDFEYPETPHVAIDSTGDPYPRGRVPTGQSGSLFPTDYADMLAGKALADDGNLYDSVQSAVDEATGYVIVGPGTFNESVSISTSGLTLTGCGYDTLIDGGTSGNGIGVSENNVTINNLSVQTTAGAGNTYDGIQANGGDYATIENVWVRDSDNYGIAGDRSSSSYWTIESCVVESADESGIRVGSSSICNNNNIQNTGQHGVISNHDDAIVTNNIIINVARDGISSPANDVLFGSNRIHNVGNYGIYTSGTDPLIYNNRISGISTGGISTGNATNATLDGNLIGPAN